jgi:hypothetical protein
MVCSKIIIDEWEQICYVADTLNIDTKKSAEALKKFNFH